MTTAIVVAVEEELRAILKRMPRAERVSAGGISFVRGVLGGQGIVLAKSGMGAERAFRTTRLLLDLANPDNLLVAGFCAGLAAGIVPGDLIVATALSGPGGYRGSDRLKATIAFSPSGAGVLRPIVPDREMLKRARTVGMDTSVHFGPLMTSPVVLRKAEEKRRLADGRRTIAADMESRGAVTAAEAAGIPWLVVRAVTDGLADDLPIDFDRFVDGNGEAARGRIAAHVAVRPWLAPALIRLGARSALAARNLAAFVEQYVSFNLE